MLAALNAGRLLPSTVQRYLQMEANWFLRLFMPLQGFRERLLADPSFFVKVNIECGIGIGTKVTAEKAKRQGRFRDEMDFVVANVIMAVLADFMLVWLPAPTLAFRGTAPAKANALARLFANCPDNAFQRVPAGQAAWSLVERGGAVVRNGAKLLGVGAASSMVGVLITNTLIALRGAGGGAGDAQNPLAMSAGYASYMATSSNLRYQVVAGVIEERGIETLFAGKPQLCHALSFVLRTANTYLGSLMWVDYLRFLGLQPKSAASDK